MSELFRVLVARQYYLMSGQKWLLGWELRETAGNSIKNTYRYILKRYDVSVCTYLSRCNVTTTTYPFDAQTVSNPPSPGSHCLFGCLWKIHESTQNHMFQSQLDRWNNTKKEKKKQKTADNAVGDRQNINMACILKVYLTTSMQFDIWVKLRLLRLNLRRFAHE